MKLWYKKSLVFFLAGLSYCFGFFFSDPSKFGFCSGLQSGSYICRVPGAVNIGWPLIDLGQMLAIVAIALLFANAATFRKWLKFTIFYVPIAVLLVFLIYPIRIAVLSPVLSRSQGIYPFGKLFVVITLGIVLWDFFISRRSKR